MRTERRSVPRFRVGDWVSFRYGPQRVWAQVVEDRGPLGVNRRRLYRIRFDFDPKEATTFEMPEDELEPAAPDKAAVLRYLQQGGLVAILRSNLGGGPSPPRVWLTFAPRGAVAHTFAGDRGLMGGALVPSGALYEGRVFTAKREEVLAFLARFGLTRGEAEYVLHAVGTAP